MLVGALAVGVGAAADLHWHALREHTPTVIGTLDASDPDDDVLFFRVINSTAGSDVFAVDHDGRVTLADERTTFPGDVPDEIDIFLGISDGKDESVAKVGLSVHTGTCTACATVVAEIHEALGERIMQSKISNHDARAAFTSMNFTEIVVNICERRSELLMTDKYRDTCLHLAKKVYPLLVQAFSGRLKPQWSESLDHSMTFRRIASLCNVTIPYCRGYLPPSTEGGAIEVFKRFQKDRCRRCATVADDLQAQFDRVVLRSTETKVAQAKQVPEKMSMQALRNELRDQHKQDTHGMRRDLERRLKKARSAQMAGRARVRRDVLSRGAVISFMDGFCRSMRARHFPQISSNVEYTCEDLLENYEDEILSMLLDREMGGRSEDLAPKLCLDMTSQCSSKQLKDAKAPWMWSPWLGQGSCFSKEMASKSKPLLVGMGGPEL